MSLLYFGYIYKNSSDSAKAYAPAGNITITIINIEQPVRNPPKQHIPACGSSETNKTQIHTSTAIIIRKSQDTNTYVVFF